MTVSARTANRATRPGSGRSARPTPTSRGCTTRWPICARTSRWPGSTGSQGRPYRPFWAITKHADIMDIERHNDLFISDPRPLLAPAEADDAMKAQQEAGIGLRTLIHMDDPHHRDVRKIGADWFRPKAMRDLKVRVDELAKRYVDKMREIGPGMRLRHRHRGQLPALRDPVAARPAGVRLPADAQAHPGDVRRRRRGAPARRQHRGHAGGAAGLLHLLRQPDRLAPRAPDRRPGLGDRQRPHRRRTAVGHGHRVLLRDRRQRRPRHHQGRHLGWPARAHRATPANWHGCATT